jgi:hypothetical protein
MMLEYEQFWSEHRICLQLACIAAVFTYTPGTLLPPPPEQPMRTAARGGGGQRRGLLRRQLRRARNEAASVSRASI